MKKLLSFIARRVGLCGAQAADEQRELLGIVEQFREDRANTMAALIASERARRAEYRSLRREVELLRNFRRQAEFEMMKNGISIPDLPVIDQPSRH